MPLFPRPLPNPPDRSSASAGPGIGLLGMGAGGGCGVGVGLGWGVGFGFGAEYINVEPEWSLKEVQSSNPLQGVMRQIQTAVPGGHAPKEGGAAE
uniref:Uncharacterized protein n=1 Tax=Tetraselmis sp. GSL018 TaxID=582737 RepID=A0A061S9R2_9CHLO